MGKAKHCVVFKKFLTYPYNLKAGLVGPAFTCINKESF